MPRITKRPGDVLKFPLTGRDQHAYAQWLPDATARVFLAACTAGLSLREVLQLPVAFRILVFRDTPNRYGWSKVGWAEVPVECSQPMRYAKRDVLTGCLSSYLAGIETPATKDEIAGLETLAVWTHPHIVERLEAQLEGRESKFLKSVSVTT